MGKMSNKKTILIFPLLLLVLSTLVLAIGWAPGLPDEGSEESPPGTPQKTYDSTLQITEITAKVDGKKDTIQNSGEKIGKEAKENSDIDFEVNVKNIWDKQIKDITVEVAIQDIDDGDDLEEDANINSLSQGDSKKADISFKLPLKVDDGSYDITINVKGKDSDNNIHAVSWALTLEVKKDKNKVIISKAYLSPSSLDCSRLTLLTISVLNLGREDEEVKIEVRNDKLGINLKEENIELDTGTDDNAEHEATFRLDLPASAEAGTYPISIDAYYTKGKSIASKKIELLIKDCAGSKQGILSTKAQPSSNSETLKNYQQAKMPKTIISAESNGSMVLLLTITLILILGLIIFLLGVIIIQLRR